MSDERLVQIRSRFRKPTSPAWPRRQDDDDIRWLLSEVEKLRAENERLWEIAKDYGKHSSGCNYPFDPAYGCKCGWLDAEKQLEADQP